MTQVVDWLIPAVIGMPLFFLAIGLGYLLWLAWSVYSKIRSGQ